ncbi:MAG: S41 family peptidase [Deltaproteobacteria bacterium]|nr:S41 family peptidase [Deltaproteobacteria bacterium]
MRYFFISLVALVSFFQAPQAKSGEQPILSEPDETEEDSESEDFWEGIEFTANDFTEVRKYVKMYYIDPNYNRKLCWIEAAQAVLYGIEKKRELLPENFYNSKKVSGDPEEKKLFSGKVYKLDPQDKFLIHYIQEPDKKKKQKKLSDAEISEKKEKQRKRLEEREKAWESIEFGETEFKRIVDHLMETEKENKNFKKSKVYIHAAQGYLSALDPHSNIIAQKSWDKTTQETVDSSFEGIGAILVKDGEFIKIESPIEGQPAQKAGLKPGDIILKVNGKNVKGFDLDKVVKRIRGEKGTPVTLTISRENEPAEFDVTIIRDRIEVKNVHAKLIKQHKDIGYVKLAGFTDVSAVEFEKACKKLAAETKEARLRGLVIDLRNNAGGLLQESIDLSDLFLDEGVIVRVKDNSNVKDEVYNAVKGSIDVPVVVITNSGSASAAEIFASAIQENMRGLVIGERSFGKASVQSLFTPFLRRDYYIKLTVARYYAPSGRTIQVAGVMPDIAVPPDKGKEEPAGFREEDLWHHLSKIPSNYESPNKKLVQEVLECDKKTGIGDIVIDSDPNPDIKYDYQLLKAADYLECMIDLRSQ